MHSVKLDISDDVYDNVMFFLSNVPKTDLRIVEDNMLQTQKKSTIVEFFQNSPLDETVDLSRLQENYESRVSF